MIRRPPRSTLDRSSAASDVYKRQVHELVLAFETGVALFELIGDLQQHLGEVGQRAARGADVGHEAVSYTHLRAHETVLDLVCRLLLEKKTTDK